MLIYACTNKSLLKDRFTKTLKSELFCCLHVLPFVKWGHLGKSYLQQLLWMGVEYNMPSARVSLKNVWFHLIYVQVPLSLSTEVFINELTCQSAMEAQAFSGISQGMRTQIQIKIISLGNTQGLCRRLLYHLRKLTSKTCIACLVAFIYYVFIYLLANNSRPELQV